MHKFIDPKEIASESPSSVGRCLARPQSTSYYVALTQHLRSFLSFSLRRSILTGIDLFIIEGLNEPIVATRQQGPHQRTEPVDVVIAGKRGSSDIRSKRPSWIETATSEVDA
jgi:hypothetical protein